MQISIHPARLLRLAGRNLANPARFQRLADRVWPVTAVLSLLLFGVGLYYALFASPPDYQQGDTVRIMYVHVPAAWMGMFAYALMAVASAVLLIWRHPLAGLAARAAAPFGAMFTGLALLTGSIWGKPMWGTWWVWDARLTSVLVLFFLYLGAMALWRAIEDGEKAMRATAILVLVGAINLPIIKFSVDWWNTLHQPASVLRLDGPTIDTAMLWPLFTMGLAYAALFMTLHLWRIKALLAESKAAALEAAAAEAA